MPDPAPPTRRRSVARAALIGVVLGLVCQALPPEHREICRAIANLCTLGNAP